MNEMTFKELRIKNELTAKDVAFSIGVQLGTYYKYEEYDRLPSKKRFEKIKETFKCTDEELAATISIHKRKIMMKSLKNNRSLRCSK